MAGQILNPYANGQILDPYANVPQQEPFDFWAPTYKAADGTLYAHGFTGNTFAVNIHDYVAFGLPLTTPNTPGICEVTVKKSRAFDQKKGAGTDFARFTLHGIEASPVEIKVTIWTPEQLKALQLLWKYLFPGPVKSTTVKTTTTTGTGGFTGATGSTQANTITLKTNEKLTKIKVPVAPVTAYHPNLKFHDINTLIFVGGEGPAPGRTTRTREFVMRAFEYREPNKKKATTTPVAPKATLLDPDAHQPPGTDSANNGPG